MKGINEFFNPCKGAVLELLKMGGVPCDEATYKKRIEICRTCPKRTGEGTAMRCKECGCCLDAKTRFEFHWMEGGGKTPIECPLKKW